MTQPLFQTLTEQDISDFFLGAESAVCYAAPGIQKRPAETLASVAGVLGSDLITICLDFDERVFRLGFGDLDAVKLLRDSGIDVRSSPGLRTGLVVVDNEGYVFTPTALYLEADERPQGALNAMRMSHEQVKEALARLSPSAKAVALAMARSEEEKAEIRAAAVEVPSKAVSAMEVAEIERRLNAAPAMKFDVARQVRVYNAYLQYVEMKLSGAAIERHRLAIPASIHRLGGAKDLEGRLRTTFDLIEKGTKLSAKALVDRLNALRSDFTRSLGKDHGRVVLKSGKPLLEERLEALKADLETHQKTVQAELQLQLDQSRKSIVEYYKPMVLKSPPDAVRGLFTGTPEKSAEDWLNRELERVFPTAKSLIGTMRLEVRYKDVTFETLNDPNFLKTVKEAFPDSDWDRVHEEYRAAGEPGSGQQ